MALLPLTITNAVSPQISIKMVGDGSERCVGYANGQAAFISPSDGSNHTYEVVVTDGDCRVSGFFNLLCQAQTTPNPIFTLGPVNQPGCSNGSLSDGLVQIQNIDHADRYKILLNNSFLYGGSCTSPDGRWSGSDGVVILPHPAPGQSLTYTIRAYNGEDCNHWWDQNVTLVSPTCSQGSTNPFFTASVGQPVCNNGTLSGATISLGSVQNADRYFYMAGSTYTGSTDCSAPMGAISGGSAVINVPAPAPGQSQVYTIRAYNGTNCSQWWDQTVTVTSPQCQGSSGTLGVVTVNFTFDNKPSQTYAARFNPTTPTAHYKSRAVIESGPLAGQSSISEHGFEFSRFVGGANPNTAVLVASYDPMGFQGTIPEKVFNRHMLSCNRLRALGYSGSVSVALYATMLSEPTSQAQPYYGLGSQGTNAGDLIETPRSNGADFYFSGTPSTSRDTGLVEVIGGFTKNVERLVARCLINLTTNTVSLVAAS